jgi:expansin
VRLPAVAPLAVLVLANLPACSEGGADEQNASMADGGDPSSGGMGSSDEAASSTQSTDGSEGDAGVCAQPPQPQFPKVGLTQYVQTTANNCDLPWPVDNRYAAASSSEYDMGSLGPSGACGRCLQLTGPTGLTATLAIVDQCPTASNPTCANGHLDLSPQAYAAVVPSSYPSGGEVVNGESNASWKYVACPVSGPIVYHFKDGTNPYWIAVQVRNSRLGIKAIRYLTATGAWEDARPRTDSLAYFVIPGWGSNAISLQVVDESGRTLQDDNLQFAPNGDVPGHAQFPSCPLAP